MASYPTSKVHRPSRRRLGRGQATQVGAATFVMTSSGDVATLTFTTPVVVGGKVDLHVVGGPTYVSQAQTAPNVVTVTYNSALSTHTWSVGPQTPISTFQGGGVAPSAGTF